MIEGRLLMCQELLGRVPTFDDLRECVEILKELQEIEENA